MQRILRQQFLMRIAALAAGVLWSGCSTSTQLAATWRDPAAEPIRFREPVVVFVSKDAAFRHTMEDKMAAHFPNAVQSYRVLANDDVSDATRVLDRLHQRGFDGAIMMDVQNVTNVTTYTPGTYWYGDPYHTFAGYWGTIWRYPYDPGVVSHDVVVSIETQIYSLRNDRLLWAARSETTDPASVGKLGDSVLRHVVDELHKEGLVAVFCADFDCGKVNATH
jgi:hypothetical protein